MGAKTQLNKIECRHGCVEFFILIFGSIILVSFFEHVYWFEREIIMDLPSETISVELTLNGGIRFIYGCTVQNNEELLEFKEADGGCIRNPNGTYLQFSEPISPDDFCSRVKELYAESDDVFLMFARWFPNCYLSQICVLVIMILLWSRGKFDIAMLVLLVAELIYAIVGLVIRPIGVAMILNKTLGVTGGDLRYPWIIILAFGTMATFVFFGLSVWFVNQQWPNFGNSSSICGAWKCDTEAEKNGIPVSKILTLELLNEREKLKPNGEEKAEYENAV